MIPVALYSAIRGLREGGIALALIYAFGVTASIEIIGARFGGAAAPTMLAWVDPTVRRYLAYENALRAYVDSARRVKRLMGQATARAVSQG